MMISVPSFWSRVVSSARADDEWPGWMLSYATQHCLLSRKQRPLRNNPFSKKKTIAKLMAVTAGEFVNDLFTAESFSGIVSVVSGVHRVHALSLLTGDLVVPDDVDTLLLRFALRAMDERSYLIRSATLLGVRILSCDLWGRRILRIYQGT